MVVDLSLRTLLGISKQQNRQVRILYRKKFHPTKRQGSPVMNDQTRKRQSQIWLRDTMIDLSLRILLRVSKQEIRIFRSKQLKCCHPKN
jgi:hypothetical protein